MNLLKPSLALTCSIIYFTQVFSQNTITVRQEFSISPLSVFNGSQHTPTTGGALDEQGSGYGLAAGYTVLFGWAGLAFNFYAQSTEVNEEELKDRYSYESVISGNYQSYGFMTGLDLNIPLTKNDFKTFVHIGFVAGGCMATLPYQEFIFENGENYKYVKMKNAGIAFGASLGFKADLTNHFSLSLDLDGLSERTIIPRESYGSLEKMEYYKWTCNYTRIKLNVIYKF